MNMEKPNILIVEDETITALDIQIRLKKHGYKDVDYVTTGEEAVKFVETGNVNLILMDIKLKGIMHGIHTTQLIGTKHDIPIIYVSGNTEKNMLHSLEDTNPVGIIRKPINDSELFKFVDRALNTSK